MKPAIRWLAAIAAACSLHVQAAGVPSADVDKLTLAYLNAKVYASGAVSCNPKKVGERWMVGCVNRQLGGKSNPAVWLYEGGQFKSINGTAQGLAEGKLSRSPGIGTMPLPLPKDIDVGAAVAAFQ